jgi:hypothetical protein
MLLVGGWLLWPGDCNWSQLTALLLGRLLGVLLFTEARSMERAIQWSLMKPESEFIRLVPTKVFADLLLLLVALRLTERAMRTALLELNVLTGSSHLANWTEVKVEPQWKATLPAVFQAATPSADFNYSRPAIAINRRPVTSRDPSQVLHNESCVFTERVDMHTICIRTLIAAQAPQTSTST